MARAHRTAAIGRSKDAKKPSPVVATSRPPKRASSPRPSWWVLVEQVATAPVAQLGGQRGRVHDVGEQQRRQHPIRVGPGAGAGEELLELVHQAVDAFGERQMVGARQLDELRALDRRRGHPGLLHGHDRVACPVEHEGRCPDRGQDIGDVGLHRLTVVVRPGSGPDREALEPRELLVEALVAHPAGREELHPLSSVTALAWSISSTSSIDSIGRPAARVWALVKVNSTSERHSSGWAAASSTAAIVPSFRPITAALSDRAALSTATASPTWVWRSGS